MLVIVRRKSGDAKKLKLPALFFFNNDISSCDIRVYITVMDYGACNLNYYR